MISTTSRDCIRLGTKGVGFLKIQSSTTQSLKKGKERLLASVYCSTVILSVLIVDILLRRVHIQFCTDWFE